MISDQNRAESNLFKPEGLTQRTKPPKLINYNIKFIKNLFYNSEIIFKIYGIFHSIYCTIYVLLSIIVH